MPNFLTTDNSGYIAGETSQSNGMAEAFMHTINRDYARISAVPTAEAVMRQ